MNNECLNKVTQDIEQLITDTKKLISDASSASTQEVNELKIEGIAILDKALERLNVSKKQIIQAGDYALCKAKCGVHEHPIACLGIAAILGGIFGALIAKKQ